ncbi:CtsR family transcriptional regulator [Calderihabitans maritimus]|uniref:Transcriptional regulator CtsR n=1 Tax=Calderihabitans maritimus TaxID=1246530 RepID=A0A1Z5HNY1_9FIRM|nr:CtsR family transcriptional regulator [Calderihabitans maritimus]GAW91148.1 transcriptional repressor CtsR [Calderihabitans maritimus]
MRSLADRIEQYLKQLLARSPKGEVEIRRNDLAQRFACVPSQINYVLSTRFTVEQGYLVESRRGGGGFLRIIKLPLRREEEKILHFINQTIGDMITQQAAEGLIDRLFEEGLLTKRESLIMKAVVNRQALPLELPERDLVRSSIMKAMLLTVLKENIK